MTVLLPTIVVVEKIEKSWITSKHTLRYQKLVEKKFSISESLTIVISILMTTFPQEIKIFGRGNQKLFKFKEFSLYVKQGKLNALA